MKLLNDTEYEIVERFSPRHTIYLRKRAGDKNGVADVHPNKLHSQLNFAKAAVAGRNKEFIEHIANMRNLLTGATVKDEVVPRLVLNEIEREKLRMQAAIKGIDPEVIDELTVKKLPTYREVLFPPRMKVATASAAIVE